MTEHDENERDSSTSPDPEEGNEATSPPANPDVDEDAVEKSREGLDQAGGGH